MRPRRAFAKASIFFSPERRKSRKSIARYLQVSHTLRRTRYSCKPFSVVTPLMTCLSVANALIACSALLSRGWPSAAPRVHGHCLTKVRSISIGISLATLRIKSCGTCIPWSVNVVAIFARTLMLSDVNPNRFWASTCSGVSLM